MVLEILKELQNSNTEIRKKVILQNNKDNFEFTETLRLAIDPREVFYIKSFDFPNEYKNEITLTEAFKEIKKLQTGEVTGNAAYTFVTELLSKLSERNAEVLSRVLVKKLQCDIGLKTVNAVYGNTFILKTPYMRCDTLNDDTIKKINFPAILQEKMDGQFINMICKSKDEVVFLSRSDVYYDFLETFNKDCEFIVNKYGPCVLMGELLVKDKDGNICDRQTGNGIIQKGCKYTLTSEEAENIFITVWDILILDEFENGKSSTPYKERLARVMELQSAKVQPIFSLEVNSETEVFTQVKKWIKEGKEGGILKEMTGTWKNGTSKEQLKVKNIFEVELVITGFHEGDKNSYAAGTLGSLICESSDGLLKCKVSGMTWEMRNEFWDNQDKYIGKIITVAANKTSKNKNGENSLYLPRFIEVREDKTEADSYERILEQEQGLIK